MRIRSHREIRLWVLGVRNLYPLMHDHRASEASPTPCNINIMCAPITLAKTLTEAAAPIETACSYTLILSCIHSIVET